MDSTKEQSGNRRHLWSGGTGLSGVHRTVSGAPPDSVRCTRGLQLKLATFGNFSGRRAIIHRTVRCTSDSVRCTSGATAISAPTATCSTFNARAARAEVRRAHTGAPDNEQAPDIQAGPEVRSSNGQNPTALVTWLGHRTCPVCTGLSGAPSNRQPPPTVKFGGWGYKYPNHPHIQDIQVFHFSTTYKS